MATGDKQTPARVCVAVLALVVGVGATACRGPIPTAGSPESIASKTPERSPADVLPGGPPPVTVSAGGVSLELQAWTYCYGNVCADGFQPPADVPELGRADQVEIGFPIPGWTFEAEFVPVAQTCPRRHSVPVEKTGELTHLLGPAGPADTYDVTLFGRGEGDLFVTFRWTTPTDGPMPVPAGRLAVLAGHDGAVDSYGVELALWNLAETPASATADITVTSSDGESLGFRAIRLADCIGEGALYWDGPDAAGLAAVELGPPPFRYDVLVTLDGAAYRASATWPADEIDGNEPSVALTFTPPLPALQ